ncbi:MAG: hypothetical protein ACXV8X_11260, partial [Candidatus Angelobacter sp.]
MPVKRIGISSPFFLLFVLLGAATFGFAQQEHQNEGQGKHEKQAKPEKQHAQQWQQGQGRQHAQLQQQGQSRQHAQLQRQGQGRQHVQQRRTAPQQREQEGAQRNAWQQHRARSWESEHRTWHQRGGYNGFRIPDNDFHRRYGRNHWFRVYRLPFMVVGGYPRFQYGGYWFTFLDPYPEFWGNNWYETDDVYVDYFDDGYYLYNRRYPGRPGIAISIS